MKLLYADHHTVTFEIVNNAIIGKIHCSSELGSFCHFICGEEHCWDPYQCHHPKLDTGACVIADIANIDFLGDQYAGPDHETADGSICILWDNEADFFVWMYSEDVV